MTAEWVAAIATSVAAGIALVATIAAIRYYRQYHKEVLQKNTMDLFDRFESDPVINESLSYMSKVKEKNQGDYAPVENAETRSHVIKILNFLEGIAHRMDMGIVDKEAVESQFRDYIVVYVSVFIKNKEYRQRKCSAKLLEPEAPNEVKYLMALYEKWAEPTSPDEE